MLADPNQYQRRVEVHLRYMILPVTPIPYRLVVVAP